MKNRSRKEKQGNRINESSSTFFEPSFSKITFRKRGHESNLEMLSDIGEEENFWPKRLDCGQSKDLNQSNLVDNNSEHSRDKKKRKKKKDVSKEGCTYKNADEDNTIKSEAEFKSPELNCNTSYNPNVCAKKKKENVSETLSHKPSRGKKYLTGRNKDEEQPVVEVGLGFHSNTLNYSVSSSDSPNVLKKKKKKKKHLSEDPLHIKPSLGKEYFPDQNEDEEPVVELGGDFDSNLLNLSNSDNPNGLNKKKKKKKKCLSEDPLHKSSLGKEYLADKIEDVVELGVGFPSNKLNYTVSSSNNHYGLNEKKKKKKHLSEDSLHTKPSLGKEYFPDKNEDEEPVVEFGGGFDSKALNLSSSDKPNVLNKKNKKKKHLSEDLLHKPDIGNGYLAGRIEDEKPVVELEEGFDLNGIHFSNSDNPNDLNKKKKKKKKCLSEDPLHKSSLSKEYLAVRNEDEEPVVELGEGFYSNTLNYSVSSSDNPNGLNEKKIKKKQLPEEPFHKLNVKMNQVEVEGSLRAEFDVKKGRTKHKKLKIDGEEPEVFGLHDKNSTFPKEKASIKNKRNNEVDISNFTVVPDFKLKNLNHEEFSERFKTCLNSPTKEHKTKHSQSGENVMEVGCAVVSSLLKKKKKTQQLVDASNLNISSKEQIKKGRRGSENKLDTTSNDFIQLISKDTDTPKSPLLHIKKRKTEKLLEECNLNMSNNEQFQNYSNTENNEVQVSNYLNTAQAVQSSCKTEYELLVKSNYGDKIKSSDTECNYTKSKINEQSSSERLLAESKPPLLVPSSPTTNIEDIEHIGKDCQLKKKHKNPLKNSLLINSLDLPKRDNSEEREGKNLKLLTPGFKEIKHKKHISKEELKTKFTTSAKLCDIKNLVRIAGPSESKDTNERSNAREEVKDTKQNMCSPRKKKEIKNNIEFLRNQLLKGAISGTKGAEDLPSKSRKLKTGVKEDDDTLRKRLLQKAISNTKEAQDLLPKSTKLKRRVEGNVENLRKRLLQEAISGTKVAEDLSLTRKLKTGVKENGGTLRKCLPKEAINGTKVYEHLPPKSTEIKTGVEENVDSLRKCLLREAISGTKGDEALPLKSTKQKAGVEKRIKACLNNVDKKGKNEFHKDLKDKLKKNHKKKHKYKSNDIDKLTDILLSKALEKVSSSSASHSSRENINLLNVEAKCADLKSGNNIFKLNKLKSNLTEQKSDNFHDQESKHKSEIDKRPY